MKNFSPKQLAARWNVAKSTVYSLVASGRLPALRVGVGRGTIRVSEADVMAFEARHTRDDATAVLEHFR